MNPTKRVMDTLQVKNNKTLTLSIFLADLILVLRSIDTIAENTFQFFDTDELFTTLIDYIAIQPQLKLSLGSNIIPCILSQLSNSMTHFIFTRHVLTHSSTLFYMTESWLIY